MKRTDDFEIFNPWRSVSFAMSVAASPNEPSKPVEVPPPPQQPTEVPAPPQPVEVPPPPPPNEVPAPPGPSDVPLR